MPRREREEESLALKDNHEEDRALKIRKSRLVAKTEQSNILLHRALKVARGFERQKLGRRQKAAKENPQELLRLKEEIIVLKQLDLAKTAEDYLFKQLFRTKRIRGSSAFAGIHGKDAETKIKGVKAGAEANVVGRLMNSNPVKEVMPEIMSGIYRCLGLGQSPSATNANLELKKVTSSSHLEVKSISRDADDNVTDSSQERLSHTGEDHHSDISVDSSDDELMAGLDEPITVASDCGNSDVDEDMAQYGHRLASSSASEAEPFAVEDNNFRNRSFHQNGRSQPTEAMSISPSPSLTPSNVPSKPAEAKPPPVHTTFLPSLTLGGYFSGSDSASNFDSDPDADSTNLHHGNSSKRAPGPALPQPRANRRGQRARQQIAEKKYGSGAKHLQKQQETQAKARAQNRDTGWDVRKGATTDGAEGRRKWKSGRIGDRQDRRTKATGANGEAMAATRKRRDDPKKGDGDGPIHPSWEAAKKRKAQSAKVTDLFQGKKIRFD